MADPDLNESAWQRAKNDSAGVYPTTAFQIGGALMTLIVGAIAAVASADGNPSIQIAIPVLGGAAALGMTFLAVLAFQLVAAPIRQRNELRGAWTAPEAQTGIGVKLWNAHRKGCDLSTRIATEPGRDSYYRKAAEEWTQETADLMAGNVSQEAARDFFTAGRYEGDLERQIDDRTTELEKIIEGLG